VVFHLGLPRLGPAAAAGRRRLLGLIYGDRSRGPVVDDEPPPRRPPAVACAALAAERAADGPAPTQLEVVDALCAVPGQPRPDRIPPRFAAMSMGGAMAEALATSLDVATGRLGERWAPAGDRRRDLVSLARSPLPLPG
jgi:hypothetical protein